jgi:hypothetical protein
MTETVVAVQPLQNPEDEAVSAAAIDVPDRRELDELEVARELVRQAREAGVALTGPGGLLKAMTKTVIETALDMRTETNTDKDEEQLDKEQPSDSQRSRGRR